MDVKIKISLVLILVLAATATIGFWVKNAWPLSVQSLLGVGVAATLVLTGLAAVLSMWNSMKTGQPEKDEMTVKLNHKAGYYAWIVTIYIALAVGWVADDVPGIAPRHASTAVLLLSAIAYFIILAALKFRGDLE